jgi:hypothetical protein
MATLPDASYPATKKVFTPKVNLQDVVDANDVNLAYTEIAQIEGDLLGSSLDTNGSSSYSQPLSKSRLVSGTFISTGNYANGTEAWPGGLRARLLNIEAGLYAAYTNRLEANGNGQISLTNITNKGITIRGTGIRGTVTNATVSAGLITFTVTGLTTSATFAEDQVVKITGVNSTGNTSGTVDKGFNVTGAITELVGSAPYTGFKVAIPASYPSTWTDTYTSGGAAVVYQTANLQEWSKWDGSTETAVAKVSATGAFSAKSIYGGNAASVW